MTAWRTALRLLGVVGVMAGLGDPGCATTRRPIIDVLVLDGVPDAGGRVARLAAAVPWAEVRQAPAPGAEPSRESAAARVVVGDAGLVLASLVERGAALAIRADGDALELARLTVASEVASGTRADIGASITHLPGRTGRVRVRVMDAATGVALAEGDATVPSPAPPSILVHVPWIPARAGQVRLRAVAEWVGDGLVRASAPADTDVRVRDVRVAVDVLEARPSWSARFARLALAGMPGFTVRTETRVAPGLITGTDTGPAEPAGAAHLTLVGGVEALTTADVARLTTEVRDRGRTLILVADEVPRAGPWTRLWPQVPGSARSSSTPVRARLGSHVWHVREWLATAAATDARPLAYEDGGTAIVWGRPLGSGRVVLVGALDAWRWRADEGTDFSGGWRALVLSLALDQRPPLSLLTWLGHAADGRLVELAVTTAPGAVVEQVRIASGRGLEEWARPLQLEPTHGGHWRARAAWPTGTPAPVTAAGLRAGRVVADDTAVIDLRASAPVATWLDVIRHQAGVGALAATEAGAPDALSTLREGLNAPPGARWYVTRTWWYAAFVLVALGLEWILRRLHGER